MAASDERVYAFPSKVLCASVFSFVSFYVSAPFIASLTSFHKSPGLPAAPCLAGMPACREEEEECSSLRGLDDDEDWRGGGKVGRTVAFANDAINNVANARSRVSRDCRPRALASLAIQSPVAMYGTV